MSDVDNYIVGLDIGASTICAVICELDASEELNILGIGSCLTEGVRKGKIEDTDLLKGAIQKALARANKLAGVTPKRVVTNISFFGVEFVQNPGFILSSSDTGQITYSEKIECIRRSKNIVRSDDQMIMHAVPLYYKVDGTRVANPVNVYGRNLEVETHLVLSNSQAIGQITTILKSLSLRIDGFIYDPIASSQVLLTLEERKKGVLFIDIGGSFTKVNLIKHNLLYQSHIIPIGGDTFTNDVKQCLETSFSEADRLKTVYGDTFLPRVSSDKEISFSTKDHGRVSIKQEFLCQILEARLKELMSIIQSYTVSPKASFQSIVLGGGGCLLSGLAESFKRESSIPVRVGLPDHVQSIVENLTYSSAIGLVLYALKNRAISYLPPKQRPFFSVAKRLREKIYGFLE